MPRLFIASTFSQETAERLGRAADVLRGRLPRGTWVRPEALHLTWAFLGDQRDDVVALLGESLAERLRDQRPVEVSFGRVGFFPGRGRPRVGWIAIEPADEMLPLAERVRDAVSATAVAFDSKPFKPHLTLVRMREPWSERDRESFGAEIGKLEPVRETIRSVSLYASTLTSSGPIHTVLRTIELE